MNNKIKSFINKLSEPKIFKNIIYTVGIMFVSFLIFQAGMFVGLYKSSFRHDWDDNFFRNFGPRNNGRMIGGDIQDNFPNAHGAIGKIIKIEFPTMIIADKDNTEKVILITDDTKIRQMRQEGTFDDLKIGTYVVVIGSPNNQGQIEARLLRIIPNSIDSIVPNTNSPIIPTTSSNNTLKQ